MPDERASNDPTAFGALDVPEFSDSAQLACTAAEIDSALGRIADGARRVLPGRAFAVVALHRGREYVAVASAGLDGAPGAAQALVHGDAAGPYREAVASRAVVCVPDVSTERRWGGFAVAAAECGAGCVYCHPFDAGGGAGGALCLYASETGVFTADAVEVISVAAEHVGLLLRAARSAREQGELADQMRRALQSRSVIDQALGIVMAQQRCGREAAFKILSSASQHRNVKVAELAAQIVSAVSGAPPEPAPFARPSARADGGGRHGQPPRTDRPAVSSPVDESTRWA